MSAFCPQSSSGSTASTKTCGGIKLLCAICGFNTLISTPNVLDSCCDGCKGIDDFTCVKFYDEETENGVKTTFVTTFSSSTTTLSPETQEEIEFVDTLRSYFQTSNEFSTPEERVLMLNALKELHYKSFLKAFKDANPESTMNVEEFRAMLENR